MKTFYDKDGNALGTFLEEGDAVSGGGVALYNHHIVLGTNYEGDVLVYLQTDSNNQMDYAALYEYIITHGFPVYENVGESEEEPTPDYWVLGGCVSGRILVEYAQTEEGENTYSAVVNLRAYEGNSNSQEVEMEVEEEAPSSNYVIEVDVVTGLQGIEVDGYAINDTVTPVSSSNSNENSNNNESEEEEIPSEEGPATEE